MVLLILVLVLPPPYVSSLFNLQFNNDKPVVFSMYSEPQQRWINRTAVRNQEAEKVLSWRSHVSVMSGCGLVHLVPHRTSPHPSLRASSWKCPSFTAAHINRCRFHTCPYWAVSYCSGGKAKCLYLSHTVILSLLHVWAELQGCKRCLEELVLTRCFLWSIKGKV